MEMVQIFKYFYSQKRNTNYDKDKEYFILCYMINFKQNEQKLFSNNKIKRDQDSYMKDEITGTKKLQKILQEKKF